MERTLDAKGRWRNRTVGFRVSEEEAKMIDRMVALSGLTKQEYILRKLMDWEVTVQGNPRVYKALKNQMQQIYGELKTGRQRWRISWMWNGWRRRMKSDGENKARRPPF